MGLARGETLEQRLKRDKQLPAAIVERLLDRLLDGLEQVHKAGFLHRDVKPANIILDAKDNPTLIDFGASRAAMADRTAAMTAIFTPRYAAAEQLTSDKQGPWTDIYSVSATLYHAITGTAAAQFPGTRAQRQPTSRWPDFRWRAFRPARCSGIDAGLALRAKDRPQSIAVWRDGPSSTEAPDGAVTRPSSARVKPQRRAADARPSRAATRPIPRRFRRPVLNRRRRRRLPDVRTVGFAAAGKNRIKLYAGVMAAILILAVGGYLVFAPGSAPPPAPFGDQKADDVRTAAAKAQAERQRAEEEAARQKAEAEAQQKAAAEAAAEGSGRSPAKGSGRGPAEGGGRGQAEGAPSQKAAGQQKAAAEAQQKAAAEAQQKAAAEAQQKAAAEAQQKAAAEAQQKAAAEAQQKAPAEASRRPCRGPAEGSGGGSAESSGRSAAEGSGRGPAEGGRRSQAKAEAEAQQKAAAEAKQKADAEAKQKAEADAAAQKAAEAAETALQLARPTVSGSRWR